MQYMLLTNIYYDVFRHAANLTPPQLVMKT